MGDLTTYDTVKHLLLNRTSLRDNYITHGLSSICSGLVAAIVSTPADVVKTRIMNQGSDSAGRPLLYKSSMDCLLKSVKQEGFWSLYKGFLPIWARMVCIYTSYFHKFLIIPIISSCSTCVLISPHSPFKPF
nr:mitochondrial uncoupling protein 4-like [Lytechinus pictus]